MRTSCSMCCGASYCLFCRGRIPKFSNVLHIDYCLTGGSIPRPTQYILHSKLRSDRIQLLHKLYSTMLLPFVAETTLVLSNLDLLEQTYRNPCFQKAQAFLCHQVARLSACPKAISARLHSLISTCPLNMCAAFGAILQHDTA